MQMTVPTGRANYEPNSLDEAGERPGPRESAEGFATFDNASGASDGRDEGKVRVRSGTFRDHYSQARMFFRSQTEIEQAHLASAIVFELSKVTLEHVRTRVLSNLCNVDMDLATRVSAGLGVDCPAASEPAAEPVDLPLAPSLSIVRRAGPGLIGRKVGILFANGSSRSTVVKLKSDVEAAGATAVLVAQRLRGTIPDKGELVADAQLAGTPSVMFDAIALVLESEAAEALAQDAAAVQFVMDAYGHLKAIGCTPGAQPLLDRAGVVSDAGIVDLDSGFADAASKRFYEREPSVRLLA
jgi:catalase